MDEMPPHWSAPDDGCVVFCGMAPSTLVGSGSCGLIAIEDDIPLHAVFNQVQKVFSDHRRWEDDLRTVVTEDGSLQSLLDVGSSLIGNLLILADVSYKPLASSMHGRPFPDTTDRNLPQDLEMGAMDLALIKDVVPLCRDKHGVQRGYHPTRGYDLLYTNIFDGDLNLGFLSLHPIERELEERDADLLGLLSVYTTSLMRQLEPDDEGPMASLRSGLESMLEGGYVQRDELAAHAAGLGFDITDRYRCTAILLPSKVSDEYNSFLHRRLLTKLPKAIVFRHGEYLMMLTNEVRDDERREHLSWLDALLRDAGTTAGLSDDFSDLMDFTLYAQEAQVAARRGQKSKMPVIAFARCWDDYVLDNCSGMLPPQALYTSGFRRVLDYDRVSSVDYLQTLQVWLEEGGNESHAATRLSICRNSFLYRMRQLQHLLDDDLSNPDARFRLWLCLRLYYHGQKDLDDTPETTGAKRP